MCGAFTDNQPDFSWLAPGETKTFSQYWYPVAGTGPAVTATLEQQLARLHLTRADLAAWQPPATTRERPRTPKA